MKLAAALLLLSPGCIAVGAISGGMVGTLAPIAIAADMGHGEPASAQAVILCGLTGAGLGALLGILHDMDNKPAREPDDHASR